jgi:D-sedoheptulose 7-phosphate isomerase
MKLKLSTLRRLEETVSRYPALSDVQNAVARAVEIICECHQSGGKVLTCGNGGSAADSEHIVGELMKSFALPRLLGKEHSDLLQAQCGDGQELASRLRCGVAAIALTANSAVTTAIANDGDPDLIFAQQIYVYGKPGDVLLALSTSGNSCSVVKGLQVARVFGLRTIGLTGSRPALMDDLCDALIKVPAEETFQVQEFHLPIYHTICLMVEAELFADEN